MKVQYNITGTDRKRLVAAISQELNAPTNYLGAPSFAYKIGVYHIDQNGTVTGMDNRELVANLQSVHGFTAVSEDYDIPLHTVDEPDCLVISLPKDDFTETAITNLERLIECKGSLIKKALGIDNLALEVTDEAISFPWFSGELTSDEVSAYTKFVSALCEMVKTQKRITSTARETDNEKYAFRCFLLQLGFIGADFKTERKILLRNLSGNGAFKTGSAKQQNMSEACMQCLQGGTDE